MGKGWWNVPMGRIVTAINILERALSVRTGGVCGFLLSLNVSIGRVY